MRGSHLDLKELFILESVRQEVESDEDEAFRKIQMELE